MCFLWRKRKEYVENVKKAEIVSEITCSKGIPHTFQSPNVQHVESIAEEWRKFSFLLGNA